MNNRISKSAPETAAPQRKTASSVAARCVIACGALLAASGYGVSKVFGAPPFVPIAAANEQAISNDQTRDQKPDAAKSAAAKPEAKPGTVSSADMSTHAAAQWKTTPDAFAPLSYFAANCARCHGPNGSFYGASFAKTRDEAGLHQIVHDMAFGPAQAPLDDAKLEVLVAYHRSLIDKKPFLSLSSVTSGSVSSISPPQSSKKGEAKPAVKRKTEKAVTPKHGATPKTTPSKAALTKAASAKAASAKAVAAKAVAAKPTKQKSAAEDGFFTDSRVGSMGGAKLLRGTGRRIPSTPVLILQGEATPGARVSLKQGSQVIEARRSGDTWHIDLPAASLATAVEITAEKEGVKTVLRVAQNAWSHAMPDASTNAADANTQGAATVGGENK